jgi:hypothetical protein
MGTLTGQTEHLGMSQPWHDANFAQINIGRNVGETPMDAFDWGLFKLSVRQIADLFRGASTTIIEVEGQGGEWLGVPEDTHLFMIISPLIKDQFIVDHVKECLSSIAKEFGQDAIALVFGTSILVEG